MEQAGRGPGPCPGSGCARSPSLGLPWGAALPAGIAQPCWHNGLVAPSPALCRRDSCKALHRQALRNADQNHAACIFLSQSLLFPAGTIYAHTLSAFSFTFPLCLHARFLTCYSLSHHSVISTTKSALPAANWKNRAAFRE